MESYLTASENFHSSAIFFIGNELPMIWYLKYDTVIYFTKIIIGLCPAELIVFFPFCFFFSLIFPC